MGKACTKCKKDKLFSEFYKQKGRTDGYRSHCKTCVEERKRTPTSRAVSVKSSRKWYLKNKEKVRVDQRATYARRKKEIGIITEWYGTKYSGTPCMDCNGVFPWCAMDFDHRPEEVKLFNISDKGHRIATKPMLARVKEEIAKCDIVCSNCHRVRTRDRKNND